MSTSNWLGGTIHDLFDIITGAENEAETADYRCVFIYNKHVSSTIYGVKVWLSAETDDGADVAIGIDTTAASDHNSGTQQALLVANETTAPVGVAFSSPDDIDDAINLGDLAPGKVRAFWIRRTATDSEALTPDGATLSISADYES